MLAVDEESPPRSAVGHHMRIALCHKRLDERGGTERDFHLTAKGLRDLGHEIHLFCSEFAIEPPSGTFAHKVPVLPFGRTAELWSFALHAPKIVQKFNCDVVVSFGRMMAQDVQWGRFSQSISSKVGETSGTETAYLAKLQRLSSQRI